MEDIASSSFSSRRTLSIIYFLVLSCRPWSQVGAFSRHYNEPLRNNSHSIGHNNYSVERIAASRRIENATSIGSFVSAHAGTSTHLNLYKENRGHPESRVYSSVTVDSAPLEKTKTRKSHRIKKVFNTVSSVFGSVIAPPPPTTVIPKAGTTTIQILPTTDDEAQAHDITFVDISWLKPHEEFVSEERVHALHEATLEWDAYKLPLLVDKASGAILDGHHRYHVGRRLGLSRLPVILVDYLNDDSINVDVWPECGLDCLSKEEVIEMSLSDNVFPPKTSKHDFVSSFESINVPLGKLR
jgi:hypothetical protein